MHFQLGIFFSFLPFNGKIETVWCPRKQLCAFHEALQTANALFRGSPIPTCLPWPWPGCERWSSLLWLPEGHPREWQMSVPEGDCIHILAVCIGWFLKSLVGFFSFCKFAIYVEKLKCHSYVYEKLYEMRYAHRILKKKQQKPPTTPHYKKHLVSSGRWHGTEVSACRLSTVLFFPLSPLSSFFVLCLSFSCFSVAGKADKTREGAGWQMGPYSAWGEASKCP